MNCCGPTRRTLLAAMGFAALLPALDVGRAAAQPNPLLTTDLEVVTITDTSVVLTWTTLTPDAAGNPVPALADTEVLLADGRVFTQAHYDATPTPYHFVEVNGLEPGRTYRFEARSRGIRATPALNLITGAPGTPESCGEFTTLTPPPGRLLHTIALANDVHFGEEVSGVIINGLPPGFRQDMPPYPQAMLSALLSDLPTRGVEKLLLAGDLTAEAAPDQVRGVRAALDGWGHEYLVTRGNHDRPHVGEDYRGCPSIDDHHDCWGESFLPRQQLTENRLGELRIIGLDTSELDGSGGSIDRPQLAHLSELLRADPDRPTLVFGHHPVTTESGLTNTGGPAFVLNGPDGAALQAMYTSAPGVFLQHSGHTHRNRRTRPDAACAVEFLEVAAVKEYPGGYSLLRLYEGGYMVNFYKMSAEQARRWSATTRGEYLGLYPEYTLGTCADRNHTVERDLSGLA
ncbi:phosphohydrolase [Nocardia panacis]|uniref:Phosphohydrolase n=1 Tax=Nocardia panacis TaxID=2340916 RepID=A0A3A4JRZ2_9NOCA|nr:phosphohydrolase [Nocardia panacis]